jgi:cyanophycinase
MIVYGRRIWKVGEGAVRIRRHAGQSDLPVEISLSSERDAADLVALRRAARDCIEGYPAQAKPRAAKVDSGTLIIIGGGGMPAGIMRRFVDLAGGGRSHIVVLPTAVPDPVDEEAGIADAFKKLGAKTVTVLPSRTLDKVESEEYLSALKQATGIWFGGGRQWRFVDAYLDTKAHALMHDVLRRGGVIMGSSAGASIQAEFLARGNPLGNLDIMADGYQRGLGFLAGAAIDQHFSQRNRHRDMLALVQRYPAWLGIGVDESTALIVRGEVGEVVGRGQVYFFDATTGTKETTSIAVAAGKKYDMTRRIAICPPAPPDAEQ